MPAYIIGQITINDHIEYQKYLAGVMDTLTPFEGRVLAADEEVAVLEGAWHANRTVVVEFPSVDHARRWYDSPNYRAVIQYRFNAARSNLVLAKGFAD